MNKKAYYFTLDAILAAIILTAGFLLATSTYKGYPEKITIKHSSDDIINMLATTKIGELCKDLDSAGGCDCSNGKVRELCESNPEKIKNKKNTILELIGELHKNGLDEDGGVLVRSIITDNKISDKFNFFVENNIIYKAAPEDTKSKLLVSSKKVVFGYWEDPATGKITYWGPYVVEVRTWQ